MSKSPQRILAVLFILIMVAGVWMLKPEAPVTSSPIPPPVASDRVSEQGHQPRDGQAAAAPIPPPASRPSPTSSSQEVGRIYGDPGRVSDIEILLESACQLEGTVLDQQGLPIAGAKIYKDARSSHQPDRPLATMSGADGRFRLDGLPRGALRLVARHPDFVDAAVETEIKDGVNTAQIVLGQGGRIEGRVTVDGRPVGGCEVLAQIETLNYQKQDGQTDSDGRYTFEMLPKCLVNLSVKLELASGTHRLRRLAEVDEGALTLVDFAFETPRSEVFGVVRDNAGAPASGVGVRLEIAGQAGTDSFDSTTDGAGQYRFDPVPAGEATLRVRVAGRSRVETFPVAAGEQVQRDIQFAQGATLECTVVNIPTGTDEIMIGLLLGHVSISEFSLSIFAELENRIVARSESRDGHARLEDIAPGPYTLLVTAVPKFETQPETHEEMEALFAQFTMVIQHLTVEDGVAVMELVVPF